MVEFLIAYKRTGGFEGGYVNDVKDKGGETFMGISRNNNPKWIGWKAVDLHKEEKAVFPGNALSDTVLVKQVQDFYHNDFWNELSLDQFNDQDIANELYDTAVNTGCGRAAMILQRSLNLLNRNEKDYPELAVDGAIGVKTIKIVNSHRDRRAVLTLMNVIQGQFYVNICEKDKTQEEFLRGWLDKRIVL